MRILRATLRQATSQEPGETTHGAACSRTPSTRFAFAGPTRLRRHPDPARPALTRHTACPQGSTPPRRSAPVPTRGGTGAGRRGRSVGGGLLRDASRKLRSASGVTDRGRREPRLGSADGLPADALHSCTRLIAWSRIASSKTCHRTNARAQARRGRWAMGEGEVTYIQLSHVADWAIVDRYLGRPGPLVRAFSGTGLERRPLRGPSPGPVREPLRQALMIALTAMRDEEPGARRAMRPCSPVAALDAVLEARRKGARLEANSKSLSRISPESHSEARQARC